MAIPADLIDEAWGLYSSGGRALVRPSVPILWFGDSVAFSNSRVRVVTVGLNPSRVEFPEEDRFLRFPSARVLSTPPANEAQRAIYVSALDSYFRLVPYRPWFDQGFERVLNGLSASYYDGLPNTAPGQARLPGVLRLRAAASVTRCHWRPPAPGTTPPSPCVRRGIEVDALDRASPEWA